MDSISHHHHHRSCPVRWHLHYLARSLQALSSSYRLQLNFDRDFGCGPAGLLSGVLHDHGIPYLSASVAFYLAYAIPVFILLLRMSRQFLARAFSLKQWMPVLLVGVILLNPRLIEYDLAAVTVPLALIAWRFLTTFNTQLRAPLWLGLVLVVGNCIALQSWGFWKLTEGPFIVICFAAGCWSLLKQSASSGHNHRFADGG
jgi:hypothetical protein